MRFIIICLLALVVNTFSLDLFPKELRKCSINETYVYNLEGKYSGKKIVYGLFKFLEDFGNIPVIIEVNLSNKDTYVTVASYRNKNACLFFNQLGSQLYVDLQRAAKIMNPGSCPIRKGSYVIKNMDINFNKFGIQALPKGKFRVDVTLDGSLKGIPYGCYNFYAELA